MNSQSLVVHLFMLHLIRDTLFFLGTLKILNSQKLDNLFIFKLPKFGGDWSKTVVHFFWFLRVLQK